MEIKSLNINGDEYLFETLDQLVEMLKDNNYEINLEIKKKGKIRKTKFTL